MKAIALSELLKVMSMETFRKLKARGRIELTRGAPNTEILIGSLPNRFQAALSHLSIP